MYLRWIIPLLVTLCLSLLLSACGEEDIDDPGGGGGDDTPTTAASPTSEPTQPPVSTPTPAASISIADLTTLDWQLAELDGAPIIDGSIVTMTFIPDNRSLVNGYTDCHGYMAGIEWDDTSFQISDSGPFAGLDERERVCQHPDSGPGQDAAFFAAFTETASYHASNDRLVLYDGDGEARLAFVPREVVTIDPALTDTVWALTSLNGDSLLPGTTITLAFGPEGASGNDGCNEYGSGLLVATDGRLTFAGGHETDMACLTPEGVMEQADRYTAALFSAVAYRVDVDQLELMDHDGATTLIFTRQEASATFDPSLAAHRWSLVEVNGQPAIPGSLVTLELTEGSIGGSDGCNFYGSELAYANNGSLEVATEGFTQTLVGCSTEIQAQAELVTGLLLDHPWYQIDGDRLTIGNSAGHTLVFAPQAEVLIGSTWDVPGLMTTEPNGEVRWDALIEGTEITLTFNDDGTLDGSSGCNTYGGNYTLDGASIVIDSLFSTEMACPDPPGVMEQEMAFLDTLQAVTSWEIGMNGLTLMTDDGRVLGELNVVSPSQ